LKNKIVDGSGRKCIKHKKMFDNL